MCHSQSDNCQNLFIVHKFSSPLSVSALTMSSLPFCIFSLYHIFSVFYLCTGYFIQHLSTKFDILDSKCKKSDHCFGFSFKTMIRFSFLLVLLYLLFPPSLFYLTLHKQTISLPLLYGM